MTLKDEVAKWEVVAEGDGYVVYKPDKRCPANSPPFPDGWKAYDCGGAYPRVIVYDPRRYDVVWLSTRHVGEPVGNEVVRVEASAHSCWKLIKHQECVLVRRD